VKVNKNVAAIVNGSNVSIIIVHIGRDPDPSMRSRKLWPAARVSLDHQTSGAANLRLARSTATKSSGVLAASPSGAG
jgi:hypothetical protein